MADDISRSCPVLEIPPEITVQIFAHCLPHSISAPRIDSAPLLFGRICRDWRTIALNSPELWTSLKIDRGIPVALSETWLARAQGMPLSLELEASSFNDEEWDYSEVLVVFKQHSRTWRDVTLDIPAEQMHLLGTDLPLPLLERLDIWSLSDTEPTYSAFRNAPALRWLTLGLYAHPTVLQLPWTQITTLQCRSGALTPTELLIILSYMPNITNCAFTTYNESESDPLPDVTRLGSLTSLSLETDLSEGMSQIFDHISVPALRILDLSSILFSGRVLVSRLRSFLSRSDCRLRELFIRIDGDKPCEKDFIELLEIQPTLEKFELIEGSLDLVIAICRRFTDGDRVPLLPRLISFSASPNIYPASEITTTFPVMLDALADALSARWSVPSDSLARIRECSVSWSGQITEDLDNVVAAFRPRQEELVALGITLSVG
ncbi:hypothetical protein K438DRAFT_1835241 [Mycena galopus ATCC 62051]|nr:hypothetical protein K438DRAFT_1835241 [Mycena galopus ATCC 62051]